MSMASYHIYTCKCPFGETVVPSLPLMKAVGLLPLQCPHSVNRVSSYSKYVERTLFMEGRKKYQYNVNINVTNETLSSLYSLPLDRRLHASECAGK